MINDEKNREVIVGRSVSVVPESRMNSGGVFSSDGRTALNSGAGDSGGNSGKKSFFSGLFSSGSGGGNGGGDKPKGDGILRKIKNIKHIEVIIAAAAVLLMLAIYFVGLGGGGKKATPTETVTGSDYCEKMQNELSAYVSNIKGAGKTQVIINWESSVELLLAGTESSSPNSTTKTPTVINSSGSSSPIVIKEIYPKALGVVVVCQGGADARVKVDIMMSVSTLLGVSTDKIIVLPMSK